MANERQYELVYILAPTVTDAEAEELQAEIAEQIGTLGGSIESTDVWGRRKLAYPIKRFNEGLYVVQLITGPGTMLAEIERRLRVRDQVLRQLTVRVDEDLKKARRVAEERKAAAERRRELRGIPPTDNGDAAGVDSAAASSSESGAVSAPSAGDATVVAEAAAEPASVSDAAPSTADDSGAAADGETSEVKE
jgi:small subunit ribosomal protein S6